MVSNCLGGLRNIFLVACCVREIAAKLSVPAAGIKDCLRKTAKAQPQVLSSSEQYHDQDQLERRYFISYLQFYAYLKCVLDFDEWLAVSGGGQESPRNGGAVVENFSILNNNP